MSPGPVSPESIIREALEAERHRVGWPQLWEPLVALDSLVEERDRLRETLAEGRRLVEAMDLRMPEQATEDEDGFINSYRIPVGPWHRLLGWSRGVVQGALAQRPKPRCAVCGHEAHSDSACEDCKGRPTPCPFYSPVKP